MNAISVLVFLVIVLFNCEADGGSFNLSGSFDPGFSFGRGRHEKRHKFREGEAENSTDDDNPDLPSITEAKRFKIPDVFTQAKSTREVDEEPGHNNEVARRHGSSRLHRAHKF